MNKQFLPKNWNSIFRPIALVSLPFIVLSLIIFNLFSSDAASKAASVEALPAEFEDTLVVEIGGPMDLVWTPEGQLLIPTKNGRLWIYENGNLLSTPAIDLSGVMCTNGERAIGDVAIHPAFENNRYIYLYYTFNKFGTCNESEIDGPVNRLSRFELPNTNVIDPASEVVLFDTPPLFRDHHNSGDVEFGSDGLLYVTVGDGGTARFDWPLDPSRLLGKIVRLTDTGGIPPGNAFTGADSARCNVDGVPPAGSPAGTKCQEIYNMGWRNPFRFAFDPNASGVRIFVNDVGQSTWEEISEVTSPGGNYGWPEREGPCLKDSTTDCTPDPNFADPVHWYGHGPDGAAVTGGAFVPNGVWPSSYDGTYLFADYVFGKIYQLTAGGNGCRTCSPPTSDFIQTEFTTAENVVAMTFAPHGNTQALFYATRGFGPDDIDGIRRITFVGETNRAPTAVVTANPTAGNVPLDVQFDGTGSSDPDGDSLTYEWDFESDGAPDSTDSAPTHRYTSAGSFTASLTVRDGNGGEDTATIRIDPGNTAPVPVIEVPTDGTNFFVGQLFTLQGSATDAEDGILSDSALTWEVRQHHADHFHPLLDLTTGNNIPIVAPEPEDLDAATNSFIEIRLTATDSAGLSTTVSRNVMPQTLFLTFESVPSGLELSLDGTTVTTPRTVLSWVSHNLRVNAPNQTDASGTPYTWSSWSDGGDQFHIIKVPSSPETYTAMFEESNEAMTMSQVANGDDDAEERSTGRVNSSSSDLELVEDGAPQTIGIRFQNVAVPTGAAILNAYIEFEVDEISTEPASLTFQGEDVDDPQPFAVGGNNLNNITQRSRTSAQVDWNNIPPWDAEDVKHQTPNLASIVQEIVDRSGWQNGNSMVFIVTGTGKRVAESYNGEPAAAPKLVIQYGNNGGGPTPTPTPTAPTPTPTPVGPTPTPTPEPSGCTTSGIVEAEDGEFMPAASAFEIGNDAAASGGQYIHVPNGQGNQIPLDPNQKVRFCFNVTDSGMHQITGNVYAPSGRDNSFYVRVDDQPVGGYLWNLPKNTDYREDAVNDLGTVDPVVVDLAVGEHNIDIYWREDGARLDRLTLEKVSNGTVASASLPATGIYGVLVVENTTDFEIASDLAATGISLTLVDATTEGKVVNRVLAPDVNGRYHFDQLAKGEYILTLQLADGYMTQQATEVEIDIDDDTLAAQVSFELLQFQTVDETIFLPVVR